MQLDQRSRDAGWTGTVPTAFDLRVVGLVVVLAAFAASLNVPYGGLLAALAAFAILTGGGVAGHVLGERRLRRLTDELVDRWSDAGGRIEDVTRSSSGLRTEWTVHTPDGPVTVGGLALAPLSRLSIECDGSSDELAVSTARDRLDALADEWYGDIFESGSVETLNQR